MKRIFGIFAIFILLVFVFVQIKKYQDIKENIITIGTTASYRPYTFLDEEQKFIGFEADVWDEIGKRANLSVIFKKIEFEHLFESLEKKEIDTIANQITKTDERVQKYYFTNTYVYYQAQIVVKDEIKDISDIESLSGRRVGVIKGSNYQELIGDKTSLRLYEDYEQMIDDLVNGDLEAMLDDKLAGVHAIRNNPLKIKLSGPGLGVYENAYPFIKSKRSEQLIKRVNIALEEMRQDKSLEKIALKWFPVNITKEKNID